MHNLSTRKLNYSEQSPHSIKVLLLVEHPAQVRQQSRHNFWVNISRCQNWLSILALFDQQFFDARGSITLVNNRHALEELGELLEVALHVLVRDLIPEHVDKLDAGGFEQIQFVNLRFLQLWQNQSLNVVE